jgi:hypothetical protein
MSRPDVAVKHTMKFSMTAANYVDTRVTVGELKEASAQAKYFEYALR